MAHCINNEIYNELGERWYEAFDDPVALLRAESKLIAPWIVETARARMTYAPVHAVDLGCGGGFVSNYLAENGLKTIGFDLSESSLAIAARYDKTGSVDYRHGDITNVPLKDNSVDIVSCCDVIEHVENPERIVQEAFRILRPGGMFFFHTFNRTFLAYLVVIKLVEWLVRNTPKHLHVLSLFVTPKELSMWAHSAGFKEFTTIGIAPNLLSMLDKSVFKRTVPSKLSFKFTRSLAISYAGYCKKM